jgi:hypothetical protein
MFAQKVLGVCQQTSQSLWNAGGCAKVVRSFHVDHVLGEKEKSKNKAMAMAIGESF